MDSVPGAGGTAWLKAPALPGGDNGGPELVAYPSFSSFRRLPPRVLASLRVALGIALVLWVVSRSGGWSSLRVIANSPWVLSGMALLALVGGVVEAIRLRCLLQAQGMPVTLRHSARLVAAGTFFGLALPGGTGGDLAKLYYLATEHRSRAPEVALVLIVDRGMGFLSMLIAILGLALLQPSRVASQGTVQAAVAAVGIAVLVSAALAAAATSPRLHAALARRSRFARTAVGGLFVRLMDALSAFRRQRAQLLLAFVVSLAGQGLLVSMFLLGGVVIMPGVDPAVIAFLSLVGMVANAVPVTPGGLGVGEAAFASLFALAGIDGGARLMLAWRLAILPLAGLGAAAHVTGLRQRRERDRQSTGAPSPPW